MIYKDRAIVFPTADAPLFMTRIACKLVKAASSDALKKKIDAVAAFPEFDVIYLDGAGEFIQDRVVCTEKTRNGARYVLRSGKYTQSYDVFYKPEQMDEAHEAVHAAALPRASEFERDR